MKQKSVVLLLDFHWTSNGSKGRKDEKYDKSLVHQTFNGLRLLIHSELI